MEPKIRVGAVSYLNTKPLLYGLEKLPVRRFIELSVDFPAQVAGRLLRDDIDLGLVPVAILPELPEYYIDADYCIGANGTVASVAIFSDVPLEEADTLLLDYQSRTSVQLARILLEHYWHLSPRLVPASRGYQDLIGGKTAGVVIGDRAFEQRRVSRYEYDLAEAWKAMTGLPFVFAAWVANKPLPEPFIAEFNEANQYGLDRIAEVAALYASPNLDLVEYYTRYISYRLDEQKRAGLRLFLNYLAGMKPLPAPTL